MISDDESGITLFHSSEFSEGEISPVVVHYPPQRGIVGISFIYYFCSETSVRLAPLF